jgi:peptide/nickel transport system permease protein
MSPFLKFLLRRLLTIPITLVVITAALYGMLMFSPPEERAEIYIPDRLPSNFTEEDMQRLTERIIREHGLDDPFPVQYLRWVSGLLRGQWGYSPVLNGDILGMLAERLPATAELAIYTSLFFIPLGLASGVTAAWKQNRAADNGFRLLAFVGTSIPPFILGLLLLAIFYVALHWFPPMRLGVLQGSLVRSSAFHIYTGFLTIDGLLNGRPEISLEALRHLVLPVLTLSLSHWGTLGRLTRASVIQELEKPYITAARARGVASRPVVWRHAFRNAMVPALNSTALSAASLVTGVFVVEQVFGFHGVSELITASIGTTADIPLAVGFAVFSVLLVLPLMVALDIVQAIVDPRIREGLAGG